MEFVDEVYIIGMGITKELTLFISIRNDLFLMKIYLRLLWLCCFAIARNLFKLAIQLVELAQQIKMIAAKLKREMKPAWLTT